MTSDIENVYHFSFVPNVTAFQISFVVSWNAQYNYKFFNDPGQRLLHPCWRHTVQRTRYSLQHKNINGIWPHLQCINPRFTPTHIHFQIESVSLQCLHLCRRLSETKDLSTSAQKQHPAKICKFVCSLHHSSWQRHATTSHFHSLLRPCPFLARVSQGSASWNNWTSPRKRDKKINRRGNILISMLCRLFSGCWWILRVPTGTSADSKILFYDFGISEQRSRECKCATLLEKTRHPPQIATAGRHFPWHCLAPRCALGATGRGPTQITVSAVIVIGRKLCFSFMP